MVKQNTVGQVEQVVFPDISAEPLLARIDTGAQTSAIAVSRVAKTETGLKVIFFNPSSEHFSGEHIVFNDHTHAKIISSNGQAERRYKVQLKVVIGGRTIKAWFSLADRSKQTYEILIGRNILKGKFVVDVAKEDNLSLK